MNPLFICPFWRSFLLLQRHHGGAKCCSMRIQNVSEIAQCAFKIWRERLYFLILAPRATNPAFMMKYSRVVPAMFRMSIEQIGIHLQQSSSVSSSCSLPLCVPPYTFPFISPLIFPTLSFLYTWSFLSRLLSLLSSLSLCLIPRVSIPSSILLYLSPLSLPLCLFPSVSLLISLLLLSLLCLSYVSPLSLPFHLYSVVSLPLSL